METKKSVWKTHGIRALTLSRVDLSVIRAVEAGMEYDQAMKIINDSSRSSLIIGKNRPIC